MTRIVRPVVGMSALALFVGVLGCGEWAKDYDPGVARQQQRADNDADPHKTGKGVFVTHCGKCHLVNGESLDGGGGIPSPPMPPGGGKKGPGGIEPGKKDPKGGGIEPPKKDRPKGKKPIGPDLGEVGKDSAHTADWLKDKIRDPQKHAPDSKMEAFGSDKITETQMKALVDFLLSLKGQKD